MKPAQKVTFHELPTNIRIACVPLWFGLASLFFYSLMSQMAAELDNIQIKLGVMNFAFYFATIFLIKKKNRIPFLIALTILGPVTLYNCYLIYSNFINNTVPLGLTVWWPMVHAIAFLLCFFIAMLPPAWKYYKVFEATTSSSAH